MRAPLDSAPAALRSLAVRDGRNARVGERTPLPHTPSGMRGRAGYAESPKTRIMAVRASSMNARTFGGGGFAPAWTAWRGVLGQ